MFVHGTRTSSEIWAPQVEEMRRHGHHVVAVDLPGHGLRLTERFTRAAALTTIGDAVAGCPAPPLLVGLSLGGYTSLAYAAANQHAVTGVVLSGCSTEIRGKPLGAYSRVSTAIARRFGRSAGTWHVVTDMLSAMKGYHAHADLRRLLVPVWLVNGQHDILRLGERRYLAARPGTRLHVVRGAGHDVNTHAPHAFNAILHDVLGHLHGAGTHAVEAARLVVGSAHGRGGVQALTAA